MQLNHNSTQLKIAMKQPIGSALMAWPVFTSPIAAIDSRLVGMEAMNWIVQERRERGEMHHQVFQWAMFRRSAAALQWSGRLWGWQ